MIRRTTAALATLAHRPDGDRIRVAVLGSGVTGCSFASTLLDSLAGNFLGAGGFDVTVFEQGQNVGGRASTRRFVVEHETGGGIERKHQFDHGCTSIEYPPKTDEFRTEFDRWRERGWVRPWDGNFFNAGYVQPTKKSKPRLIVGRARGAHYVGHPGMGSICERLLETRSEQSTIEVVTGTHARAKHMPSLAEVTEGTEGEDCDGRTWRIEHNSDKGIKVLGDFDWLISTDRMSAQHNRFDLKDADLHDYANHVNVKVHSLKSITTMVVLDKPLMTPVDRIDIDYYSNKILMRQKFGSLGSIVRDSSKPGRGKGSDENDRKECWVLHSNRREGARLLGLRELKGAHIGRIRKKIRDTMVGDFVRAMPLLLKITGDEGEINTDGNDDDQSQRGEHLPVVIDASGHRWGAAFPEHHGKVCRYRSKECIVDEGRRFIACGDYFGEHHGTVEGAYLSGRAAAGRLIEHVAAEFAER